MPKRQPPSRRPERKLDDTAKAIARAREKATDAAETDRLASDELKTRTSATELGTVGRKPSNPSAPSANRRQKKG